MKPNLTLFDLMRLNEGQTTQLESRLMQQAIARDQQLAKQWNILRKTYSNLLNSAGMDSLVTSSTPERSVDFDQEIAQVASYLDQRLAPEEANRFEQKCWERQDLLQEVLDCYQAKIRFEDPVFDGQETGAGPGASKRAIRQFEKLFRLPELPPSSPQEKTDQHKAKHNGSKHNGLERNGIEHNRAQHNGVENDGTHRDPAEKSTTSDRRPEQGPLQLDPTQQSCDTGPLQDQQSPQIKIQVDRDANQFQRGAARFTSSQRQILGWTVTAAVLMLLIWGSFSFPSPDDSKTVEENVPETESDGNQTDQPKGNKSNPDSSLTKKSNPPLFDKDKLSKDSLPPRELDKGPKSGVVQKMPESGVPFQQSGKNPSGDSFPQNVPQQPSEYAGKTELGWRRIKGLVAVKQRYESIWLSTNNESSFISQSQFKTLPGSWAEAKTASETVLVIDEDTTIALSGSHNGRKFKMELMHGKAGFRSVPKGAVFEVSVAGRVLNIKSLEDDSEFGVDQGKPGGQVFVRKGMMKINDADVSKGMQGSPKSSGNAEFYFAKIKSYEDVRWLSKSQSKSSFPVQLRSSLIDSRDLEADLRKLLTSKNEMTKFSAVQCRLAMDNGASLSRLVNSGDRIWRLAALEWLLKLPIHESRTKRIWSVIQDDLARALSSPNAPSLYRWQLLPLKSNDAWPDREVTLMKRLLDHRSWILRALAFYHLERKFGNDVGYHPDLPGRQLRTAAQAMRQSVDAKHQLIKRANR